MSKKRIRDRAVTFWTTLDDLALLEELARQDDSTVSQVIRTTMRRALVAAGLIRAEIAQNA